MVVRIVASLTAPSRPEAASVAVATPALGCITLTAVTVPPLLFAKLPIRRAVTLLASVAMLTGVLTSPAGASTTSYEAADSLGLLPTLVLFVGGPVGLFLLIWLLVVAGSLSRRPKQENDLSWFHELAQDEDTDTTPPAPGTAGTAQSQ